MLVCIAFYDLLSDNLESFILIEIDKRLSLQVRQLRNEICLGLVFDTEQILYLIEKFFELIFHFVVRFSLFFRPQTIDYEFRQSVIGPPVNFELQT